MIDRQADFGVEASGHHFFHALGGGDDTWTPLEITASGVLEVDADSRIDAEVQGHRHQPVPPPGKSPAPDASGWRCSTSALRRSR